MIKNKEQFIGKCLLIDTTLVVGDLHIGYGSALRRGGVFLPTDLYSRIIDDFEKIFARANVIERVILLGDLKHEFGSIPYEERSDLNLLLEFLEKKVKKIIIVKGNHDVLLEPILRLKNVSFVDYFIDSGYAFMHGNKAFKETEDSKIHTWVLGHAHPAVHLREGPKVEVYKCFLVGTYKKKKVVILPSFFPFTEGSNPLIDGSNLAWNLPLQTFLVKIVGEDLEVLDFGKLARFTD